MKIFQCRFCGGIISCEDNLSVVSCEYCGGKLCIPKIETQKDIELHDKASYYIRLKDFDKAQKEYESLLEFNKNDPELYWSIMLCYYGIEYIKENGMKTRAPKFTRGLVSSVFSNQYYLKAIENASPIQKQIYEEDAKFLEEKRRQINKDEKNQVIYEEAKKLKDENMLYSLQESMRKFEKITDYLDSKRLVEECKALIEKKKEEQRKARNKKIRIVLTAIFAPIILTALTFLSINLYNEHITIPQNYEKAIVELESGNTKTALLYFQQSSGYKDSDYYMRELLKTTITASENRTMAVTNDGIVLTAGYTRGTKHGIKLWTDIVSIDTNTISEVNSSHYGVAEAITVGVKSNGELCYYGADNYKQEVGTYTFGTDQIEWIEQDNLSFAVASDYKPLGIKTDGSLYSTYREKSKYILDLSCKFDSDIAVKSDGTVVYAYDDLDEWTEVIKVSQGYRCCFGVKEDGTVYSHNDFSYFPNANDNYGQCLVENWTKIVDVACGFRHTVGLRSDGTVICTGDNTYGQLNTEDWTDIVAVAAGDYHTVGLKADGTMVAVGDNREGQCDVADFKNIALPYEKTIQK